MKRRETVDTFRHRLRQAFASSGLSQSALARDAAIDRSTLSQLLSNDYDRLPRADSAAGLAMALNVSLDWLLGLSQDIHRGADMLKESLEIAPYAASPVDIKVSEWYRSAVGYKVRYVPANLPDIFKTPDLSRYEFQEFVTQSPEQAVQLTRDRLAYSRMPESEMEICSSLQGLQGFVRGEGIWSALDAGARRHQVERMIEIMDELYPALRWFLFDGRLRYSVPMTIFGPVRAVIYVGDMYFVFNTVDHIRALSQHFDRLIKAAIVQPPDVARLLERLLHNDGEI
ncbi:helix-turn-helix domain-containing protein [Oceanibacterium hippocampi]|uniref:Helix-turn-helix protein n=1 Tax=Oceanibacterium hippocampi TaxID=745714 RepID=A0A1Y5RCM8_9PROT|nr:helix-turn-helix transcriptional regulator [Oceanibacterium hippocampi]SLN11592.1 helix-turn-helix protein [Oceanibacterium hippocampi]